jgi:hypothetical protein
VTHSSKTSVVFQWTTWCYIPEDETFQHELYLYAKRKPKSIRRDATQDMILIAFKHLEEEEDNEFLIMARGYVLNFLKLERNGAIPLSICRQINSHHAFRRSFRTTDQKLDNFCLVIFDPSSMSSHYNLSVKS